MQRDILPHIPVVLAVARRGGFAAAAKELGMSASAVSHSVRLVEDRLGLPLFARTTRSVSLTDWGQMLVDAATPSIFGLYEALEKLQAAQGQVSGLFRITVAQPFVSMVVTPVVKEMVKRYPDLRIEISSEKRLIDIVAEEFDAGVRLGGSIEQDMKIFRLSPPFRTILVASPGYIEQHGRPTSIEDLANHNCIAYRHGGGGLYEWELETGSGEIRVPSTGNLIINDMSIGTEMAQEGIGILYMFEPWIADELADGRLVEILPEAAVEETGLFLYFPERATNNPKIRAFIDTAKAVLRQHHAGWAA